MFTRHFAHWPPGQPKTLEIPQTTVYDNLAAIAARDPDHAAIDYYGSRLSYLELKRQVDALAGYLQQRAGVARGDRVLLYLQNSPQFVIAYYAVLRADAVAVPVNPMNRTEELRHYMSDAGASVAVVGQDVHRHLEPIQGLKHILVAAYSDYLACAADLPIPDFVKAPRQALAQSWTQAIEAGLAPGPHAAGPDDLAVMPYTSGTTGRPKGCMHTHSSVQATTVPYLHWRGAQARSVVLSALPMFHVTGMQAGMNSPIHTGATLVILSRWDRDCAALQIERAGVTNWSAITTMLIDFLSNPALGKYDLSSLQVLGGGGAAMPAAVARKLEEAIGLPFIEGYGLSETMAPTHINPPHRPKRQCGGIPFYNTDARVIDLQTFHELPPDQVGEIIVHGPQVFRGYWNQPEASAQAFLSHDGKRFFRTGDLGYYDEEGYFFITDRLKRMINCAGFKVWPAEIEAMLYAHPGGHRSEKRTSWKDRAAGNHRLGARENGRLQGAAHRRIRRAAAEDRYRKDPVARASGKRESQMRIYLALLVLVATPALAQVEIQNGWSRATAPGSKAGAGYMVIRNKAASPDRLIGAASPAAERVETHVHIRDGDVVRMREVKGYDIPASGSFELKPGGAHLMFMNIKAPFKDGQKIPLVLKFERSGEVRTDLVVGKPAQPGGHQH